MLKLLANGRQLLLCLLSGIAYKQVDKARVGVADNVGMSTISADSISVIRYNYSLRPCFMAVINPAIPVLVPGSSRQDHQCALHAETLHHLRNSCWIKSVITIVLPDGCINGFAAINICLIRCPICRQFIMFTRIDSGVRIDRETGHLLSFQCFFCTLLNAIPDMLHVG